MNKKLLNVPNLITLLRFLLIIPLFFALINYQLLYSISLVVLFVSLDVLDGFLARKLEQETKFGKHFDFISDMSFSAVIFFTRLAQGYIEAWIIIVILVLMFLQLLTIIWDMKDTGIFRNSRIKLLGATNMFAYLFLILFEPNNISIYLTYLLLVSMLYFDIDYFLEVRQIKKSNS